MSVFNWSDLPSEIKLAVLDNLPLPDVWNCSRTSRDSYAVGLPLLFKTVHLPALPSVSSFLQAVPTHHLSLVRHLSISTQPPHNQHQHQPQLSNNDTNPCHYQSYDTFTHPDPKDADSVANPALVALLSACTTLESLDIKLAGSLDPASILPLFSRLERLSKLSIEALELEDVAPLSERLVVSLAFSLPRLEDLSLTRITRSALHAPELHSSNVPTVSGDDDDSVIPAHPLLGHDLRLPQLLRLPTLKRLSIRDTHLGDPMWGSANADEEQVVCPLETLDLGSCAHVSPALNEMYTARIMARAPPSITSCVLSASLPPSSFSSSYQASSPDSPTCKSPHSSLSPSSSFYSSSSSSSSSYSPTSPLSPTTPAASPTFNFNSSHSIPPLPRLHTLHLTPLVPTSALAHTLAQPALAASPVRTLSCAFHPDDVQEGCEVLEAFLKERAVRERCGEVEAKSPERQTRKRAASRLSVCSGVGDEEEEEEDGGDDDDENARTRANTVSAPSLCVSPFPSPARLYASLSTLTIDIPADPSSPLSLTSPRLSPRRLAAARRRAEERREAAGRLEVLARSLGLEVFVRGLEVHDDEHQEGEGEKKSVIERAAGAGVLRARANSA